MQEQEFWGFGYDGQTEGVPMHAIYVEIERLVPWRTTGFQRPIYLRFDAITITVKARVR